MKYIAVEWPEIQLYMEHKDYPDNVGFDPKLNLWFIPEDMYNEIENKYYDRKP
jgi:hypothetical protein